MAATSKLGQAIGRFNRNRSRIEGPPWFPYTEHRNLAQVHADNELMLKATLRKIGVHKIGYDEG